MSNLWVSVEELDTYADHEYAYDAVKVASQLLWSMSGRKYGGINTVSEKYVCASRAYRLGASARNYTPELVGGDMYNVPFDEFDVVSGENHDSRTWSIICLNENPERSFPSSALSSSSSSL